MRVLRTRGEVDEWRSSMDAATRVGCVVLRDEGDVDGMGVCKRGCDIGVAICYAAADAPMSTASHMDAVIVGSIQREIWRLDDEVKVTVEAMGSVAATGVMKLLTLVRPTSVYTSSSELAAVMRRVSEDFWIGSDVVLVSNE